MAEALMGAPALLIALTLAAAILPVRASVAATAETEGPQAVTASALIELVRADAAEQLGVPVEVVVLRELPVRTLPPGEGELTVRYPTRPGLHLPEAVDCRIDGKLRTSIPLGPYVSFKLTVLVASEDLPARAVVSPTQLAEQETTLPAGAEVVTLPEQVAGLQTRGTFAPGARLLLSRLERPYDVVRGSEVLLVIDTGGVRMEARAVALGSGYTGQRIYVKRVDDDTKYLGLICEGPKVVVQ
jgi:flagella basal body P-ring formation protein FlgA